MKRLVLLERRISQGEHAALRARWEFGRELLKARDGKGRLPNGYLEAVAEATGASRSEIKYRVQFAERVTTEDELATVVASYGSWWAIRSDFLPEPREKPGQLAMSSGHYLTCVVDPPWDYSGDTHRTWTERGGQTVRAAPPYPSMTVDEIAALNLPIGDVAHVYLWTTRRYLPAAFGVLDAWGLTYTGILVWTKAPRGFMLGGTFGSTSEFVLVARRGDLSYLSTVNRNHFDWPRPGNQHSAKPDGFFTLVEQVSPGPRIELFARTRRTGWDAWGDEIQVAA